jgi:hypothetical protein
MRPIRCRSATANSAFTVDATGLQTFPEAFEKTTPLGTLSDWGWHTSPNPNGWEH